MILSLRQINLFLTSVIFLAILAPASGAIVLAATPTPVRSEPGHPFANLRNVAFHAGYGRLPLAFEANEGQTDSRVRYIVRGTGYTLFVTDLETVMSLDRYDNSPLTKKELARGLGKVPRLLGSDVLRLSLTGVNRGVIFDAQNQLAGISNYFVGKDSTQWKNGLKQYAQLTAHDVYPGIDMVYYGTQGQLEYDFRVAPGSDPGVIRIQHTGADSSAVDGQGNLQLTLGDRGMRFKAPVMYQEVDGVKTTVTGEYVVTGTNEIGFKVGDYDKTKTLVIDPALDYSTYLSGTNGATGDFGSGIVVDSLGSAYVTGQASSSNFPTTAGAYQTVNGNMSNVFITKMSADGSSLVYSTYLGGSGRDYGTAIVLDSSNNAYLTGAAASTNFPTTSGAYQPAQAKSGVAEAFLSKISASGSSLLYSTYLGGSSGDQGNGITMDTGGHPYLTGFTNSTDFPTTSGAFQVTNNAFTSSGDNAFVSKFNPVGGGKSDLLYSTFLGGSNNDSGAGIAVDSSGNAYVAGTTGDSNFSTTSGAYQTTISGSSSSFMSKISPLGAGTADLVYSTFFDATNGIQVSAIALDANRNVYLTGNTSSSNFPTTSGAYQKTLALAGATEAFVTEINPGGHGSADLIYSSYLGGSNHDQGNGIALDSNANIYVTGYTQSSNFPTTSGAYQTAIGATGVQNAFLSMFNPGANGTVGLVYSSYLGGTTGDVANAIALDSTGNAYITGRAGSTNFPTTTSAYQKTLGDSSGSGFVAKFDVSNFPQPTATTTNTATKTATNTSTNTATNSATNSATNTITNTGTVNTSTVTNTATNTVTNTATYSATNTTTNTGTVNTSTVTNTATNSATNSATNTTTNTGTVNTLTATNTATNSATSTATYSATNTTTNTGTVSTSTVTNTATNTATNSATNTTTNTGTVNTSTVTNTATNTSTNTATNSATTTSTNTSTNTATNTATNTTTNTGTVNTLTVTNTATNSATATATNTSTNTATITATNTATNTVNLSVTNTRTNTATSTKTISPTITMTFTPTATVPLSTTGNPVLCPVPVSRNGNLCLFPDKPILSSHWDVYDWIGVSIASLNFGSNQGCWNVGNLPPGIYIVRIKVIYPDGSGQTNWQKVVVSR